MNNKAYAYMHQLPYTVVVAAAGDDCCGSGALSAGMFI
jgi:hypothetical protein